ncbi:MAG TPA: IS110 family transposase [Propionibacteriaceae bacterium]
MECLPHCVLLISSTDNDAGGFFGLVESRDVSLQGFELSASWRQASLHRPLNTVRSVFATAGPCLTFTAFKCRSTLPALSLAIRDRHHRGYWKPFYYLLEDADFTVMLVNARQVKEPARPQERCLRRRLAGSTRRTRPGPRLLRPTRPDPRAAGLTRARTAMLRERGREIQRLEKLLEDAGIKLSSVATDITCVSGRLMLQALIDGQHDPAAVADLAKRRLRAKIPELTEALTGRFSDHHAFLAGIYLDAIDQRSQQIADLTTRIEVVIEPFRSFCNLIDTIPGISERCAEVIVAETGADMSIFPTAAHLASWAGTCPGSNESAGRVKSTTTRPGNPYLKAALGAAALSIANTHGTYLATKYRRIAARRGPKKALVAIEHTILIALWTMAHTGALYDDPGADYYTRRDPERTRRNAVNQLQRLGYQVTLAPAAAPA